MLDLKGLEAVMKKLGDETQPGEVRFTASRGGENRFSYYLNGQLIFTFGLTRGSRQKSKTLPLRAATDASSEKAVSRASRLPDVEGGVQPAFDRHG